MSRDDELVRKIVELEKRLDDLVRPEVGPIFHPLTAPYTNTNFDGDSFSDVAILTKIENTDWSTTIPADAVALLLWCRIRDEGSAGTNGLYFWIYATSGGGTPTLVLFLNGIPNDQYATATVVVPCTDGDVWYVCNASGVGTLDVWLQCHGYWR